jgi:cytochrome c oxidase subunit 2
MVGALIGRTPGSIKHRKNRCRALEAEGWRAYKAPRPAARDRIHNRISRAASNGVLMKSLLKILVVAAAFGLAPSAALAQPNPAPAAAAEQAQPAAEPSATSAPAAANDNAAPAAAAASFPHMAPTPGIGQPKGHWGFQPQYGEIGEQALWFHNIILMPIITVISLFVLGLLLWVMLRYRRSANQEPSRTSHNTLIEIVWTVIPVLILVVIAIPSIDLLRAQYSPPKADLTVKVIGNQWFWTYQYPDNGDFELISNMLPEDEDKKRGEPRLLGVDERMVVPAGKVVKLIVTSNDVVHSWGIPAFWVKMDAVPGRLNETWFKVDRPGVYYGQCYELCGARHGFMPIAVEVVPPAQFAAWLASKGGTLPGGAKPASSDATANSPIANPPAPAVGATEGTASTPPPPEVVSATAKPTATNQAETH